MGCQQCHSVIHGGAFRSFWSGPCKSVCSFPKAQRVKQGRFAGHFGEGDRRWIPGITRNQDHSGARHQQRHDHHKDQAARRWKAPFFASVLVHNSPSCHAGRGLRAPSSRENR